MKKKDMINKVFGKLTPVGFSEIRNTKAYWLCKCKCGMMKVVDGSKLRSGDIKSCGCSRKEGWTPKLRKRLKQVQKGKTNSNFVHGESSTKFYKIYRGIVNRCQTKSAGNYKRYGGKGIKIEWSNYIDFKKDMYNNYKKHCAKFGTKNTTIDRIDPFGNYSKENCRWATWSIQAKNKCNKHEM